MSATLIRGNRERTPAEARLWDATARKTTAQLIAGLEHIDAMPREEVKPEHRITSAYISDVLEERHGLTAQVEAIFSDEDYAGTYTDALKAAMRAAGVTVPEQCHYCGGAYDRLAKREMCREAPASVLYHGTRDGKH